MTILQEGIAIKCDGLIQNEYVVMKNYSGIKFGPELELFVVDKDTFKPRDCLDELSGLSCFGRMVKPELAAEQIEVVSDPSPRISDLEASLRETLAQVISRLDSAGACLLPVPLLDTEEFTITPEPRYQLLIDTLGPEFRKNAVAVASDQVNIGAEDEAQAFRIFNTLRYFLPMFTGFFAASPFKQGFANGKASNRMDIYDAAIGRFPHLTGIPGEIHSLQEYAAELEALPVFQHPNMFYKYIRPMPHRGVAAEIRSIDKQPTLRETLAVMALAKALVIHSEHFKEMRNGFDSPSFSHPSLMNACVSTDVEQEMRLARQHGIVDRKLYRAALDDINRDFDEGGYLKPLYTKLEMRQPRKRECSAAYRSIAREFREEIVHV